MRIMRAHAARCRLTRKTRPPCAFPNQFYAEGFDSQLLGHPLPDSLLLCFLQMSIAAKSSIVPHRPAVGIAFVSRVQLFFFLSNAFANRLIMPSEIPIASVQCSSLCSSKAGAQTPLVPLDAVPLILDLVSIGPSISEVKTYNFPVLISSVHHLRHG